MAGDEPKIGPGLDLDDDMILSRVRELVSRGLERYGAGDLEGAMSEWEHALALDEDNAQAREYVEYVRNNIDVLDATFRAGSHSGVSAELELPFGLEEVPGGGELPDEYESLEIGGGEAALDENGGLKLAGLDAGLEGRLDAGWTLDQIELAEKEKEKSKEDSIELGDALDEIDAGLSASLDSEQEKPPSRDAAEEESLELELSAEEPAEEVVLIDAELPEEGEGEGEVEETTAAGRANRDMVDLSSYGESGSDFTLEEATSEFPRPEDADEEPTRRWPDGGPPRAGAGRGARWESLTERLHAELDARAASGSEPASVADRVGLLLSRAEEELGFGDPAMAVAALDLALAEAPKSAAAQKLLTERDSLIGDIYRRFLGASGAMLALAVPLHELEMHALDHRAAFLLSRIDAPLSVEDLLDVSGMSALEAYKHLSRLILQGILEVR